MIEKGPQNNEPNREAPPSLKQKMSDAIKSRNLQEIMSTIEELDAYLTSDASRVLRDPHQISRQEDEIKKNIVDSLERTDGKFADAYIYLNDGGVSRLVIRVIDGELHMGPAGPSSDAVKKKWEQI